MARHRQKAKPAEVRRHSRTSAALALVALMLTSGCSTIYNKERRLPYNITQETFIDAKQRVVIAAPVTTMTGGVTTRQTRFCAEPSPDALSAIAMSASGSLSLESKLAAAAAFSKSETAGSIGLRTQSIQLMRDSMFRLCEQVVSGTLDPIQYETLFRHFQNSMVAILAIEQLTGVVKPTAAALSSSAATGAAEAVAELTAGAAKAQKDAGVADDSAGARATALTKANADTKAYLAAAGAADEASLPEDKKAGYAPLKQAATNAATAKAAADVEAARAKQTLAVYQTGMNALQGGNLSSSGTAALTAGTGGPLSDATAAPIAAAVLKIVETQLGSGFFRETCATMFDKVIATNLHAVPGAGSLQKNCDDYAAASIDTLKVNNEYWRAIIRNIDSQTSLRQPLPANLPRPDAGGPIQLQPMKAPMPADR